MNDSTFQNRQRTAFWLAGIAVATCVWFALYCHLEVFADWFVAAFSLGRKTALGEAIHFFVYDTPKVLLLLTGIVFLMGIIQAFFAPKRN